MISIQWKSIEFDPNAPREMKIFFCKQTGNSINSSFVIAYFAIEVFFLFVSRLIDE